MRLGEDWRRGLPRDMRAFLPSPASGSTQSGRRDQDMRKEFMVIAAVVAVALAGYLTWQSTQEPTVETSAPTAATPQTTAPQNAPATPAQTPAQTTPAAPAQQ
jgi:hypothetical protein